MVTSWRRALAEVPRFGASSGSSRACVDDVHFIVTTRTQGVKAQRDCRAHLCKVLQVTREVLVRLGLRLNLDKTAAWTSSPAMRKRFPLGTANGSHGADAKAPWVVSFRDLGVSWRTGRSGTSDARISLRLA